MTLGYWIESPGRGALRDVDVVAPDDAALELEAVCSGVSPGTERLVGLGRVPASLHASMACRGMQGTFSLPLLYGYSFVGRVRGGDDAGPRDDGGGRYPDAAEDERGGRDDVRVGSTARGGGARGRDGG